MNEDIVVPVVAILSIFVFCPLAIAYGRLIWRRASEPQQPRSLAADEVVQRMADLQRSMDAMTLEIERIAEGQRFVTKLMSERPAAKIPSKGSAD